MKLIFLLTAAGLATAQTVNVSGERLRAHVQFLASDLLEGRAPGTRGGAITEQYLASQFLAMGAKPAGDKGTFLQRFTLVGVAPQPGSEMTMVPNGGAPVSFKWLDEFVGVTEQQKADAAFDAPAVFVGHGIVAPEYDWDDYKGTDVKGKVCMAVGLDVKKDGVFSVEKDQLKDCK